jgi:amidase
VVARTVRDSAAVLDATAGPALGDLHRATPPQRPWLDEVGADLPPLRVGLVVESPDGDAVDPECVEAATRTARVLDAAGHHIEPAPAGPLADAAGRAAFNVIVAASQAHDVLRWEELLGRRLDDLEPHIAERVEIGRALSATALVAAVDDLARWSRSLTTAHSQFDVLVTPTLAIRPPRLGTMAPLSPAAERLALNRAMTMFVLPFNVSGQPAITVPVHWAPDGLPIGAQLVAGVGREDLLIGLASLLEVALPWSGRRPTIR